MQINVNPKDIKIQYIPNPSDIEIQNLSMEYDFHEIILSDLFERNIQDKIDIYDDLMFIVCHFPKYNKGVGQYYSNEFKIILGNNFIIIISEIQSKRLSKLLQEFQKLEIESDEKYKSSPYYILYKFRDSMFDKSLKHISHFNKDLMEIEEDIYDSKLNKQVLSKIITKKEI